MTSCATTRNATRCICPCRFSPTAAESWALCGRAMLPRGGGVRHTAYIRHPGKNDSGHW
jgi:hypothetical protein